MLQIAAREGAGICILLSFKSKGQNVQNVGFFEKYKLLLTPAELQLRGHPSAGTGSP